MTRPIPPGAPRRRAARSCNACKATKVKCLEAVPKDPDDLCGVTQRELALQACKRCQAQKVDCWFDPIKRTTKQEGSADNHNVSKAHEVTPELSHSLSPPSRTTSGGPESLASSFTSPSAHSSSTPASFDVKDGGARYSGHTESRTEFVDRLVEAYLTRIHAFLPIFSCDASTLRAYLSNAPHSLQQVVWQLANFNATNSTAQSIESVTSVPSEGYTLAELQSSLVTVHLYYAQGKWSESNALLLSVSSRIIQQNWHTIDASTPQSDNASRSQSERQMIRRLFWQAWCTECAVSILTGNRDFLLLPWGSDVHFEDDLPLEVSPFPLLVQSMRLALTAAKARDSQPLQPGISNELDSQVTQLYTLTTQAYSCLAQYRTEMCNKGTLSEAALNAARTAAHNAALYASAAIILNQVPTFSPQAYSCGIDYTQVLSLESRIKIQNTLENFLGFIRESLVSRPATVSYGPHFGCTLLIPCAGALLLVAPNDDDALRANIIKELDLLASILESLSARWTLPAFHLQHVRLLQSGIALKR